MSFIDIRPYFRDILNNRGFSEWSDAFNFDNIPDNLVDRAYHLGPVSGNGILNHHRCAEQTASITVRIFFKGFRDPAEALDVSLDESNEVIRDVLKPSTRTGYSDTLKNVSFDSLSQVELDGSNDNIVRCDLSFTCNILMGLMEGP